MSNSVFIWGSCVSRDIIRVTQRFDLAGYVGRQSLVSAMNPGFKDPGPTGLKHTFQDRSLRGDIRSNGPRVLSEKAANADAIIIDLATERRGVYPVKNGFLTRTVELEKSKLLPKYKPGEVIEFGTPLHQELFTKSVEKLREHLTAIRMENRVGIVNHPFAAETSEGRHIIPNLGKTAEEWNELFPAYHEILSSAGFTVFSAPPAELSISSEDHSWGRGLDHYLDETYYFWADQIDDFISRLD